ncbi:MAG: HU family DNA-binding protein [Firmicutes bacterium]|nr:HU family DNA-binding protein [Bacillota bacterium]
MPKAKYKPENNIKSIDQLSVAKLVATHLGLSLTTVTEVIEMEQKLTMEFVRDGYKVIKKNYITFTPIKKPGYIMKSKLNGENYEIPERITVKSKPGLGFRVFVSDQRSKMPNKICRFVDKKSSSPEQVIDSTVA